MYVCSKVNEFISREVILQGFDHDHVKAYFQAVSLNVNFWSVISCTLLLEMMLHIDQSKRADIYHVANFAFNMIGKQCPIRSVQVSLTSSYFMLLKFERNRRSILLIL